jgi:hypothetical protein
MAAPHVAGAAAVYLSLHPTMPADVVQEQMIIAGAKDKLSNLTATDSNILINVESYRTSVCIKKIPLVELIFL